MWSRRQRNARLTIVSNGVTMFDFSAQYPLLVTGVRKYSSFHRRCLPSFHVEQATVIHVLDVNTWL